MEFSLTTLGTASARPTSGRFPSAHLLTAGGHFFLIDCGEGAQMQLVASHISIARIDNIFISHLHGDHIFGLFGLLSTLDLIGRVSPLYIYGPAGLQNLIDIMQEQFLKVKYPICVHVVKCSEPLLIQEFKKLSVYAFPLNHRVETYGYLFKETEPQLNVNKVAVDQLKLSIEEIVKLKKGEDIVRYGQDKKVEILKCKDLTYRPFEPRSFAYCCDTAPFDSLADWVKGVSLLYHEATYASDLKVLCDGTAHSTSQDAALCALKAGAGRLVLGHFSSRYGDLDLLLGEAREIFPESYLASEGTKFEIPVVKSSS